MYYCINTKNIQQKKNNSLYVNKIKAKSFDKEKKNKQQKRSV